MNSPEQLNIENNESLANLPDERTGINFVGVLLAGLIVNLSVALIYINTLPEAQQPTLDKTAQIQSQKP